MLYSYREMTEMPNIKPDSDNYAELQLLKQLEAGEKSAREEKWLSADEAEEMLGI